MADRISEIRERSPRIINYRHQNDVIYLLAELDKRDQRIANLRAELQCEWGAKGSEAECATFHGKPMCQHCKAIAADDEAAKSKERSHEE